MLDRFRIRLSGLGPVPLRLMLGVVFIIHGWPKFQKVLAGENPVGRLVANWPMPQLWGYAAGVTEFVGGICLLLGLLTRFWSAGLVIQMSVAMFVVHFHQGFKLHVAGGPSPSVGGYEFAFALALTALALFLLGPGPFSVDYLVGRLIRGQRANPVVGAVWPAEPVPQPPSPPAPRVSPSPPPPPPGDPAV